MAVMHHALAIPGYIIILIVLWGWLPIFVVCWLIRKLVNGPTTPEEEAQKFPRPAPGWQGPEAKEDDVKPLLLLSEKWDRQQKRREQQDNKIKRKKQEAEELEIRRRAAEKKRRAKKTQAEHERKPHRQQNEERERSKPKAKGRGREGSQQGEPRRPEPLRTHESRHHRRE